MQRSIILLFLFFTCSGSQAQTNTVYGFGNTYTYGEKENIKESNFAITYIDSAGRVFAKAYGGGMYIIGSNYTKKIKFSDSTLSPAVYLTSASFNGGYYLFSSEYVYLLKNDVIVWAKKLPLDVKQTYKIANAVYLACGSKENFITYLFKEGEFIPLHDFPTVAGVY